MTIRQRLRANVGAGGFGFIVNVFIQLVSIPLFLSFWPSARYADWLTLLAVASILALVEVGVVTPLGNELSLRVHKGDLGAARKLLATAVSAVTSNYVVVMVVLVYLGPYLTPSALPVRTIDIPTAMWILVFQVAYGWLSFLVNCTGVVFRAANHFARGAALGQVSRIFDFVAVALVLHMDNLIAVAIAPLLTRSIGVAFMLRRATKLAPWLWQRGGHGSISQREIAARVLGPGLASSLMTTTTVAINQLPVLLLNRLAAPEMVIFFVAARTLSRIPTQVSNVLIFASLPEFTILLAGGLIEKARRLAHLCFAAVGVMNLAALAAVALVGVEIFRLWTHDRVPTHYWLLLVLFSSSAAGAVWTMCANVMYSLNRYGRVTALYIAVQLVVISFWILSPSWVLLETICASMLLGDLCMLALLVRPVTQTLQESMQSLLRGVLGEACGFFRGTLVRPGNP